MNNQPRQQRGQQISGMQIIFASILAIGLLLTINFSGRIRRGQQVEEIRSNIQATLNVLTTEQAKLMSERDYAASDAAVIQWAHQEGKMIREGEVLVLPVPAGLASTPTAQAAPLPFATPSPIPIPNVWWSLFFEGEPPF